MVNNLIIKIKNFKESLENFLSSTQNNLFNYEEIKEKFIIYKNFYSDLKNEIEIYKNNNLISKDLSKEIDLVLEIIDSYFTNLNVLIAQTNSNINEFQSFLNELDSSINSINTTILEIKNKLTNIKFVSKDNILEINQLKQYLFNIKSEISELFLDIESFKNFFNETQYKQNISILKDFDLVIDSLLKILNEFINSYTEITQFLNQETENEFEKQEKEEIKWKTAKLSDLFNAKQLKQVQKIFKQTENFFNNIETILKQAEQFINIIKMVENVIEDPLSSLVQNILKKFKDFVNSFKTTGIYLLDMVEYAYIGELRFDEAIKDQLYNLDRSKYKSYLRENYFDSNELFQNDFYSADNINDFVLDLMNKNSSADKDRIDELMKKRNVGNLELSNKEEEEYVLLQQKSNKTPEETKKLEEYQKRIEESKELNKLLSENKNNFIPLMYRFKTFTYEEWIETIAEAFMDSFDLPDGALVNGTRMNRMLGREVKSKGTFDQVDFSEIKKNFLSKFNKEPNENELYTYSLLYGINFNIDRFKSGRPQFSKNTVAKVVIFMISSPDFGGFINNLELFGKLFNFHKNEPSSFKKWKNEFDSIMELFPLLDSNSQEWNDFIDNINYKNRINSLINSGENPDFYGISLYSLFPELFNNLDSISYFLENYYNDIPPLFSDQFDSLLQIVKNKIKLLKNFSNQLQNIIQFFEDLINLSVNVLIIESNEGNEDIYKKLLEAKNAPGQDSGKKMWYAGLVLAFGFPDSNKLEETLDVNQIFKESAIEFDEKTKEIKEISTENFNAFEKIIKSFR